MKFLGPLVAVVLLSAAGCTHPAVRTGDLGTAPPRTWNGGEYDPAAGQPETSAEKPVAGAYPDQMDRWEKFSGIVPRSAEWLADSLLVSEVNFAGRADKSFRGLPRVGSPVEVRRMVWPKDAEVVVKDSTKVVIATRWISTEHTVQEFRCDPTNPYAWAHVRLVSTVQVRGEELVVRQSVESRGAKRCAGTDRFRDRLRGLGTDVLLTLRRASNVGTPLPVRY